MGKNKGLIKKTILLTVGLLAISIFAAVISNSGIAGGIKETQDRAQKDIASKLIRLHVIANSNSDADQALKLKVRDKIVKSLEKEFTAMNNIDETRNFIENNLDYIEKIAQQEVEKYGKDYKVRALYGNFPFPVKTYGYITLPAGEYEALRIMIGSGKGANWWCVLFPPLCFVDITHNTLERSTKPKPKTFAKHKQHENIPVEVRFKVVEVWQQAKNKIDKKVKMALN